jgi:hypothetical protein
MERWAANTLRTLGIILTAGFVLVTSLILLLFSMCAAQNFGGGPSHSGQGVPFILAALVVEIAGVWFIVWLARGIFRFMKVVEPAEGNLSLIAPDVDASSAPSSGRRHLRLLLPDPHDHPLPLPLHVAMNHVGT